MSKRTPSKLRKKAGGAIAAFEALADAEKERIYKSLDRYIPLSETRPMPPAMRRAFEKGQRIGRPKIGKGAQVVAISIERGLLKQSDAFAKQNHMKRSELIAAGLSALMQNPKLLRRAGAA